jgi:hypothetical protein
MLPGSTDRVDHPRDLKGALWRAKSNGIADAERNLMQIIAIVSSIFAVCHDNLPVSRVRRHGGDILRKLSEHPDELSEMQALPEVTEESRQVMAKSSFAIANAMKALQKL